MPWAGIAAVKLSRDLPLLSLGTVNCCSTYTWVEPVSRLNVFGVGGPQAIVPVVGFRHALPVEVETSVVSARVERFTRTAPCRCS